jgi:hypothetical protein
MKSRMTTAPIVVIGAENYSTSRVYGRLLNVDRLKANELGRVEHDEDVADQTGLVAGQADRQSGPIILLQNGAPASIHVSDQLD